jgi:hypothetical protein
MQTRFKTVITTLGVVVCTATLTPIANAGCGEWSGKPAASIGGKLDSHLVQAAYRSEQFKLVDNDPAGADIVGLWSVKLTSLGNFDTAGIPDGATIDWGYAQWHSDGTEIMNSGSRAPATENFCLGVWAKTGPSSYKLNHVALSYNAGSGLLDGTASIREQVTVDHGGNNFTGTFTIDIFPPGASTPALHLAGNITGQRITAN